MQLPLDWNIFTEEETVRSARLLQRLRYLTSLHRERCDNYRRIVGAMPDNDGASLKKLPWISVRLFKTFEFLSVSESDVKRVVTSSGTSGRSLSKVALDSETAALQQRILIRTLEPVLGKRRLPLALVEASGKPDSNALSARGAGALGLSLFGRSVDYLQDESGQWNLNVLRGGVDKSTHAPVIFFGFTFMVWQFLLYLEQIGWKEDLGTNAVLIHTGGWKKLQELSVSNDVFKSRIAATLGIRKVHNFYGMAEQVGSVFLECVAGHLHCSAYNHVIVRDPEDWLPLPPGKEGIIQVISAIPTSYPGHSLLTEDLGRLLGDDGCSCGWRGPFFEVLGRLPKMENRGCSNV